MFTTTAKETDRCPLCDRPIIEDVSRVTYERTDSAPVHAEHLGQS